MKANQWTPNKRSELQFQRALKQAGQNIVHLLDELVYLQPNDINRAMQALTNSPEFEEFANQTAKNMVVGVNQKINRTWTFMQRSHNRKIFHTLQRELSSSLGGAIANQIARNATIIKTMPQDIAKQSTNFIANQTMKGIRASEITKELRSKYPGYTKTVVERIARTETAKTQAGLTEMRAQNIGRYWYIWRASKDSRAREAHRKMDGVICSYRSPPNPESLADTKSYGNYNPGEIFNCRCYAEVIISLSQIQFPARVCYGNRIQTMSRKDFMKLSGMEG